MAEKATPTPAPETPAAEWWRKAPNRLTPEQAEWLARANRYVAQEVVNADTSEEYHP